MYEMQLGPLMGSFNHIVTFSQTMVHARDSKTTAIIARRSWEELRKNAATLKAFGEAGDFPIIADYADSFLTEMQQTQGWMNDWVTLDVQGITMMHSVAVRLQDGVKASLRTTEAVVLDARGAKFWAPTRPLFGKTFQDNFANAQYDLDEAAKCFAVGRYPAAVFHLMRIMELGLGALHACLGIAVPLIGNDRNWGNILRRVKDEIATRGRWPEKNVFQEFYALLDSVKDAWRNSTMHVENKVTREDADRIYMTVQGFMMKLSARMDERGEPKT